jgi:acetoin utilization protein AcuB
MLVSDLITDDIPPLKVTDTIERALDWMEQFKVSHLPLVNGRELVGVIADSDLLDYNNTSETFATAKVPMIKPIIHYYQHVYDLLRLMTSLNLTVMPVLDENEKYTGSISMKGFMQNMASMISVQNPGGVIVLEVNLNDYSVTQIGSIVESNDAKILSLHVNSIPDSTKLEVTLKVNKEDLGRIIQTFNRYNYIIKATFHHSDYDNDLKNRLDEFMRFLDI